MTVLADRTRHDPVRRTHECHRTHLGLGITKDLLVKKLLSSAAERLAPRTLKNLRRLSALDPDLDRGLPLVLTYERELRALQREVDELRRDHRRVAELYDAVFEYARSNAAAAASPGRPTTAAPSTAGGQER